MARRINLPTKQIPLNLNELEKLGTLQVTHIELAAWYSISKRTIENRFDSPKRYEFQGKSMTFREIFERGQAKGRMTLRRKQMQLAESGHCTMLIWLGKNILGQRDTWSVSRKPDEMRSCFDCKLILSTDSLQLMQVWDHETRGYADHYVCLTCVKQRRSIPEIVTDKSVYNPYRHGNVTQ